MTDMVIVGRGETPEEKKPEWQGRRLISHSEVDGFLQCERKHAFAHEEKLQPKKRGAALAKGSAGHLFLEVFLQSIKDGYTNTDAIQNALQKVAGEPNAADIIPLVMYWAKEVWPTLNWKIIAVEHEFSPVPVSTSLAMPGKIDLIAEVWNEETRQWEITVIDHKFLYDPYPTPVFNMLPQIPKYIGIMRSQGIKVKAGMFNVMRTRKLNNPLDAYVQVKVHPSNAQIRQQMIEHVTVMKQIEENSKNPEYIPLRTTNKMNCGHCGFIDLCQARLEGRDTSLLEKIDFEKNTYGYTDKEIES